MLCLVLGVGAWRWVREPLRAQLSWSQAVFDERGELLRLTLSKDEKYRMYLPLKDFPKAFVDAVLLKEDRYFRWHWGLNPVAIARAAYQTYGGGGRRIGGSTISMQLARLKGGFQSRSLGGKLRQIAMALELEIFYSKDEILETYLNLLPYGSNVEGAGTASQIYFAKTPERLNLPEILTLAVIPQSPKLRALGVRGEIQSSHQLLKARDQLFELWAREYGASEDERMSLRVPFKMRGTKDLPFLAPHLVADLLGRSDASFLSPVLRTTLNRRLQKLLESRLQQYVDRHRNQGVLNAAAILVDWTNSEVKALVGSVDFFNDAISGQVNGTQALRSPGSTLKPFAYALAFDQGLMHTQSLLKDAPASFAGFDPENFDRDFQGPITAEQALIRSRNLPAVAVASQLSHPSFYEFLQQAGIPNMKPAEHYGLSTILGGLEVSMQDLVRLYAMLPNQGELRSLRRLKSEAVRVEGQLLTPEASFMVLDILRQMPRPGAAGGSRWTQDRDDIYWKTGTSQAFRDAWTLGIAGRYVLAVWLGNFDGRSNPVFIGRDLAAPLFFEVVDALKASEPLQAPFNFKADLNLKKVKVCSLSGQLPGPHCQHQTNTWFVPGVSPIATCELHRQIRIDERTGLRLCDLLAADSSIRSRAQVFEFWPSDLLKLFSQAGMARALPPAWDPRCGLRDLVTQGAAPKITSPKLDIVYSLRALAQVQTTVVFSAVADADVRETFWFVNDAFVGKTKPREALFWNAKPGHHSVRVVDDQGRSDSRPLEVEVVN